jgi:putative ABC transport system permease protein
MHQFLSSYAFHTRMGMPVFLIPAVGILLLALITVFYQSLQASLSNPADSLRNE